MNGSLQLREFPGDIVRLSCEKCGRSGQYRKQKLIERYGADMRLPDLREQIATMQAHRKGGKLLQPSLPPLSNRSQRDWGVEGERPINSINLA